MSTTLAATTDGPVLHASPAIPNVRERKVVRSIRKDIAVSVLPIALASRSLRFAHEPNNGAGRPLQRALLGCCSFALRQRERVVRPLDQVERRVRKAANEPADLRAVPQRVLRTLH